MKIWIWILAVGLILLILWRFTGRTRERFDVPPVCPEGFRMFDQENTLCLREMEHVCPNYAPFGIAGADISERCSNEADGSGMKFAAVCPPGSRLGGEFGDTCYKSATPTCPAGYIKHDPNQNGIQMCKEPTAAAAEAAVEAAEVARARADLPDPPAPADPPAVADPLAEAPAAEAPAAEAPAVVEPTPSVSSSAAVRVDASRTSGTTTGGTSGTTQGANSGGGGNRRQQVFGPLFMGQGDPGPAGVDSSTTNRYPELLGGNSGRESTRTGAGIVQPSGIGITLPSLNSLGLNANSNMFPFSRSPGDMETIPDPFRVSQQFSASSYSSKTEPVPFLTDFSAFQS